MFAIFKRFVVQKAPKSKTLVIKSKIDQHDLSNKLNQAIRFLSKGMIVQIKFEHADVKKKRYLQQQAKQNNTVMTTRIGWNIDKTGYKDIVESSVAKLNPYIKSTPQKLTNVDPFVTTIKLLGDSKVEEESSK